MIYIATITKSDGNSWRRVGESRRFHYKREAVDFKKEVEKNGGEVVVTKGK